MAEKKFRDYKPDGPNWITLATGEYYPDVLPGACRLYAPVLEEFGELLKKAHSSTSFFLSIMATPNTWMRTQLCRVFKRYVHPGLPVEMLKRKNQAQSICDEYGGHFRDIASVHGRFSSRPLPDETLCAILWEYKDRGKKGYTLTESLFQILRQNLSAYEIVGPEGAGRDVILGEIFQDYPKPDRPVDFMIMQGNHVAAIGLARYDSDRGGAQEDDRPGQYRNAAQEIIEYADTHELSRIKVIFVNDGPGLLLGSMWDDYADIEDNWPSRVKVATLRMVSTRITSDWLES